MQCSCGGETIPASHEVKTLSKATEWFPWVKGYQLPITVERDRCPACGRARKIILSNTGEAIYTAG